MKLLYIVNARIPTEKAHGYQICKMCEEFASTGVEVELIVPTRKNHITEDTFSYYALKRNFTIQSMKCFDFLPLDKFFSRKVVYLNTLAFFLKVCFLKIDRNTIIYTRNPELVWLFNLRGFTTVYECHDWFKGKLWLALFFLRKINFLVTTNGYIKNEFIKRGFADRRILVAPNGVDIDIFNINLSKEEAIEKLPITEDLRSIMKKKKIVLYSGSYKTMGVEKGIDEILMAMRSLRSRGIIFLAVGGDSNSIEYYGKKAKELGVESCSFLLGRFTREVLAIFQKSSDILLMPFPDKAHYRYYMTPLKIFEYLCSQRPIIASDLPSIREILNKKNSIFCQPDDHRDLEDKIKFLITNEDLGREISAQAFEDAKKYSWKSRTEKILSWIKTADL